MNSDSLVCLRRAVCALALAVLVVDAAHAQTPVDFSSLYVSYSTRKAQANPQGAVRVQLDSLDRAMAAAVRGGRTGEARRLIAQANVVLAGRTWTDSLEFANSLRLRADRIVIESGAPFALRLEQTYAPRVELTRALSVRVALRRRAAAPQASDIVKEFELFEGVSRDLLDAPLTMELDLRDVADGNYSFSVEVLDSTRVLGHASMPVLVSKGVDAHAARLAKEAATAPAALRGELLFAGDRMHTVNRGSLPLSAFNADREFAAADTALAAVKSGKDPFAGKTGDLKRHYVLDAAKEVMPYRVYVPAKYKPSTPLPLIIALHGLGGSEDGFFDSYEKRMPQLAEERGYLVATPLGYRPDGFYGSSVSVSPRDAAARRRSELSEADVLAVLAEMRRNYNVDPARIYLMGHSMGAIGTWSIAAKHPDAWAALGVFSGLGDSASVGSMKRIPQFVVHGDADATVNVRGSRTMVAALKTAGTDVQYTEVPGGSHMSVVVPNLAAMFDFFAAHKR